MMNPTSKRIIPSKTIPSACWLAVISFFARTRLIVNPQNLTRKVRGAVTHPRLSSLSGQLLLASGAGSTAVLRRAATRLRRRRRSCQTKCHNRHQHHYFQLLHDFSPLHLDRVLVWRMEHPRDEPIGIGSCSKCEECGFGAERLFPRAKRLAGFLDCSRKAERKDGIPATATPPRTTARANETADPASASTWRPKDSTKPSEQLACFSRKLRGRDGSMARHQPSRRYHLHLPPG